MATIYDIARQAGVAPATVSRVINQHPDVSEKTRARVMNIMSELGYEPNAMARSLASRRSMQIGVFYQDHVNSGFRHPFFHDVLASFSGVIGHAGYDLLFFSNDLPGSRLTTFESRARNRRVDGLLLLGVPRDHGDLSGLWNSKIPCVSVDMGFVGPRAGCVSSDNIAGAHQAVNYLVSNGHREIAYIGGANVTKPGEDRLIGFQQALRSHGLVFRPEWVMPGDFTEESGFVAAETLLRMTPRPAAIFCAGDLMAIGAMKAIEQHGMNVGVDISVVGFDDITLAKYVSPGLTTIRQRKDQMGQQAAYALLELIENINQVPRVVTVDTELVVRGTVLPRHTS